MSEPGADQGLDLLAESEDQSALRQLARDVASREVAPRAHQADEEGVVPAEVRKALASADLLRITVGERWGGMGLGDVEASIVLEEIARADVSSAICCQLTFNGPPRGIEHLGPDAMKDRWLPAVANGDALISIGITEPDAGSAVQNMRASLTEDGPGRWRLNAYKNYSTLGDVAEGVLVWCRWPGGEGAKGIGAVIVPTDREGVSVTGRHQGMGIHAATEAELAFDGVEITADDVLLQGDPSSTAAFKVLLSHLNHERCGNASMCIGAAQGALEHAVRYMNERVIGGRPLAELQGLQWKLADMAVQLEGARLLLARAVRLAGPHGTPPPLETALAKTAANLAAKFVCDEAMQIHGGYGYSREYPLERRVSRHPRAVLRCRDGGGAAELHRAAGVGRRPYGVAGLEGPARLARHRCDNWPSRRTDAGADAASAVCERRKVHGVGERRRRHGFVLVAAAVSLAAFTLAVLAPPLAGGDASQRQRGSTVHHHRAAGSRRPSTKTTTTVPSPPFQSGLGPPYTVQSEAITLSDPSRATPARGSVPAASGRLLVTELFVPSGAAGPLPLVVFAHGWNSDPGVYGPLLQQWAQAGFLVAAPVFPDSTDLYAGSPVSDYADQALDISFIITALLHGSAGVRVDPGRIAVAGHSDGGTDVALLALDPAYADPRVGAFVCMAGEMPSGIAPYVIGSSPAALLVAAGSNDEYGDYTRSISVFDAARTSSKAMVVDQGGHHLGSFIATTPDAEAMREETTRFLERALEPRPPTSAQVLAALAPVGSPSLTVVPPP